MIPTAGYTLMYIFLTIGHGAPSVFTPWLNISRDNYYALNRFLVLPSMILGWWVASVFMHLVGRAWGSTRPFDDLLSLVGLSIGVAMWGGLIHDLPMSFLSAVSVINAREHEVAMNSATPWRTLLWSCYSIYFVAFLVLFTKSVRKVHAMSKAGSILTGTLGFLLFQVTYLIFNR